MKLKLSKWENNNIWVLSLRYKASFCLVTLRAKRGILHMYSSSCSDEGYEFRKTSKMY